MKKEYQRYKHYFFEQCLKEGLSLGAGCMDNLNNSLSTRISPCSELLTL